MCESTLPPAFVMLPRVWPRQRTDVCALAAAAGLLAKASRSELQRCVFKAGALFCGSRALLSHSCGFLALELVFGLEKALAHSPYEAPGVV